MATTPGRTTRVVIDPPRSFAVQPSWQATLDMESVSLGQSPDTQNVLFWPQIGWRIAEYQATLSVLHEMDEADDAVETFTTPTGSVTGTGFILYKKQRTPDELNGLGSVGTRASGDNVYKKNVVAGDSVAVNDSVDQAVLPPPPNGAVPMDRVAVGTAIHEPNEGLCFRFFIPSVPGGAAGSVIRLYFTGIPTYLVTDDLPGRARGTGRYCLDVWGDGQAFLVEYCQDGDSAGWQIRKAIQWSVPQLVADAWHVVSILSDAREVSPGVWTGSRILLRFETMGATGPQAALAFVLATIVPHVFEHLTYQKEEIQPVLSVLRLDVRRDVFCEFQVSRNKYRPTGAVRTVTKATPFVPRAPENGTAPIYVTVFGDLPVGTSVEIDLRCEDAGDASCATSGPTYGTTTFFGRGFTPVPGKRRYYAVLTLHASADAKITPTVRSVGFYRPPVYKTVITAPAVEILGTDLAPSVLCGVSVNGPSDDPTHESAALVVKDVGNGLARLDQRADVPVRVDVLGVDPEDEDAFSIVFSGRIARAKKKVVGSSEAGYPRPYWGIRECACVGEWAELAESQASQRWELNQRDPADGETPYTVTSALRTFFEDAGIAPTRYHVPSSPMRLFTTGDANEKLLVEPYAPLLPIIVDLAWEYWGAYVVFDPNATNGGGAADVQGCWRVVVPQRPPYRILAHFLFEPNVPGRDVVHPGAYADIEGVRSTFVEKGSLVTWVDPPEGNKVRVVGSAPATGGITHAVKGGAYEAILHNWKAADFGQGSSGPNPAPDPTYPDWTNGRPRVIPHTNGALTTQKRTNFVAQRIFDRSCHARHFKLFQAPLLLVWDTGDGLQIRPRPLRFGDFVYFDGVLHVVNSVGFAYAEARDEFQMAAYELFTVPALLGDGVTPDAIHKAVAGRMR